MTVQALGYVGVRAKDLEDWASYGSNFLGLQRIDKSRSSLAFRMDDRKQRLVIDSSMPNREQFFNDRLRQQHAVGDYADLLGD